MINAQSDRILARQKFLQGAGWADAIEDALGGDASTRSYARLTRGDEQALLMDAPPAAEGAICPPHANAEERAGLGYNAVARLAAGRLDAFVSIAEWLQSAGVRAPTILGADGKAGFALIEDFGSMHLKDCDPRDLPARYRGAMAVLRRLRDMPLAPGQIGDWWLHEYDAVALQAEADLLIDWYAPHYAGQQLSDLARQDWYRVWSGLFAALSPATTMVLRDYHAENILIPPRGDLAVIDFQDALLGQPAYDVVSLLEDARRDVDPGLAQELIAEDRATFSDPEAYDRDYAILAAQRNMKILGVFARLIHRDSKPRYADFFPRVQAHVAADLARPEVAALREWAERYMPALLSVTGGAR